MASIGRTRTKSRNSGSLDAMAEEVENQIDDLPKLVKKLRSQGSLRGTVPSKMMFTGSGDSFATALLAHSLSLGRAMAEDPYELYLNPERTKGKTLFLISVSGKTRTNIRLAKLVQGLAWKRVAITANPDSPLARACDSIIALRFRSSGILTAGTIGFTSGLLAVASLVSRLPRILDLDRMERRAAEWAETVRVSDHSSFFFIGSGIGYGLAAYGAFKMHEVLGMKAEYQYPEQFGHAELFSVRRSVDRVFCISSGSDSKIIGLFRRLSKESFRVYLLEGKAEHPVSACLEIALHLQHLALRLAKRMRVRECAFRSKRTRLRLSTRLIY